MTTTGTLGPTAAATFERRGPVALITLNRPAALNAVNADLSVAVGTALEELENDPDVRVGVVTGAGRAFCAGADLKEVAAARDIGVPGHPEWGFAGLVEHALSKPLIAAVNGLALGGGLEIVLACDLAVMSADATLGLPEVKRGLFPGAAGLIRLPRQMPAKLAMEYALTGERISSESAERHGLVNRVVPADRVLDTVMGLASAVAENAPMAVQVCKRLVRRAVGADSDWDRDVYRDQAEAIAAILASHDGIEGATAFAQKRTPVWTGA